MILRPQIAPADALLLSLVAGIAAFDAVVETTGIRPDIRWPNDLLVNEKKVCGILAELSSDSSRVHHAVIGVGINVNHRVFPEELRGVATSLCLEAERTIPRTELTVALIKSMDREYRILLRAVNSPAATA